MVTKKTAPKVAKKIVSKVKTKPKPKKAPPKKPVLKKTPPKKTPPKKKNISPLVIPGAAALGITTAAVVGSTKDKTASNNNDKNTGGSFNDAFRTARNKGEGTLFSHNGKKYIAVTKDDLKNKGYSSLAEYNKAGGKKKIVSAPDKTELTRKQKRRQRRKERIGFETFKERRQARRAKRKAAKNPSKSSNNSGFGFKSGGMVSSKKSTPRGVGAAKRGFGKALR